MIFVYLSNYIPQVFFLDANKGLSAVLIIVQEFLLPLFGIPSMVSGLNVSTENIAFFYGVMIAGFIVAGILVS